MTTKLNPQQYLDHLLECIDKYSRHEISLKEFSNAYSDYWRYYIGVNIIPAFSIGKKPLEKWKEYQDTPIPESQHEQWKNNGAFISGLAIITGKVWHRIDLQNYYFVGIDADNQKAIDELLTINGRPRTIEQFSKVTIVEQHDNNKDKLHFYVYTVGRQLRDKTSDLTGNNIDPSTIPTFEVKASPKFLMYPSPSINKQNHSRKILGTYDPIILKDDLIDEMQEHIDEICKKYGLIHGGYNDNQIPIKDLFKEDFTVYEGHNRHLPLLRTMESLIARVGDFLSEAQIIELGRQWNYTHCKPPLDEREFEKQWNCATRFISEKKVESFIGDVSEGKKEKKPSFIEIASEAILARYHFATLIGSEDIYYYENGTYVPNGDVIIKQTAEALYGYDQSIGMRREIQEHIKNQTYHELSEFDSDLNIINMANGLYDIQSNTLKPHTHKYLSINQIPVIYNPEARPKLFGKFLSEVLYPEEIKTLIDLMAYTFYRDNPFEIITILHGDGSNGKSVVFGILTALHGMHNVSNVSLKTIIERPFGLFDLVGKSCNLDAELSSGAIEDTAILKKITGRQVIRVEQKNQKAFDARIYAKEWISANEIPMTTDQTDAFFRRNIVIAFPNKFDIDENLEKGIHKFDPHLIYKLTTSEELSGIFNVLMDSLRRIFKNKEIFIHERTIQERRDRYELVVDPIQGFLDTAIDEESKETDTTTKDVAYAAYLEFCKIYKINGGSKDSFGKSMKKHKIHDNYAHEKKKSYRIWLGIKLTEKYLKFPLVRQAFVKVHKDGLQGNLGV